MADDAGGSGPVRRGEELHLARLGPWLDEEVGLGGEVAVTQFPGGHSNLTYLLSSGGREVVLRRPPFGSKVKTAHDMGREFRVLSALAPVFGRVPRPLALCEDEAILGCRFYVMERLAGVILRRDVPAGWALDAAAARRLCASFVDTLAELHAVDVAAAGLAGFGRPEGYAARQVAGWTERYLGARTDDIPDVDRVAAWLAAHLPADAPGAVIHNDYKLDNLVLDAADPTRIVGILDWEMATVGDPLMDLGTALCYWVESGDPEELQAARFGPTTLPGMMTRSEIVARYAERTGRGPIDATFYYAFGLFKTAVVAQQIYYRYRKGLTADRRFGSFLGAVRTLARQAIRATC